MIRNGKTYKLFCPGGCGTHTGTLTLDRPFDPKRDDIAYCNNRRTCPLPPRKFKLVNRTALRIAQLRASAAMIARKSGLALRQRREEHLQPPRHRGVTG